MAINNSIKKKVGLTVRKATRQGAYETIRDKATTSAVKGATTGGAVAMRNSAVQGAVKGATTSGLAAQKKKIEPLATATKINRARTRKK